MDSCVKGSSEASLVSGGFGDYQMVNLARAVSAEWDEKQSGFKGKVNE